MNATTLVSRLVFASSLLALAHCGGHKYPVKPPATQAESVQPTATQQVLQPGDEGAGSLDAHPQDCNKVCNKVVLDANTTADCPTVVGTGIPCEGFCLVDESVQPVWANEPPSSGPVYPRPNWVWGEHKEVVPRGFWVHSLAHGFVVISYNCPGGCDNDLQAIRNVMLDRAGTPIIFTPDPLLTGSKFAAVAWTWQYTFDTVDSAALRCFIMQHNSHDWPH